MKFLVSEDWDAIINSENIIRAEIVSNATTMDLDSKTLKYAVDVWTKDGLTYRLGKFKTKKYAQGQLAYIMSNLICDTGDILSLTPDEPREPMHFEF